MKIEKLDDGRETRDGVLYCSRCNTRRCKRVGGWNECVPDPRPGYVTDIESPEQIRAACRRGSR